MARIAGRPEPSVSAGRSILPAASPVPAGRGAPSPAAPLSRTDGQTDGPGLWPASLFRPARNARLTPGRAHCAVSPAWWRVGRGQAECSVSGSICSCLSLFPPPNAGPCAWTAADRRAAQGRAPGARRSGTRHVWLCDAVGITDAFFSLHSPRISSFEGYLWFDQSYEQPPTIPGGEKSLSKEFRFFNSFPVLMLRYGVKFLNFQFISFFKYIFY